MLVAAADGDDNEAREAAAVIVRQAAVLIYHQITPLPSLPPSLPSPRPRAQVGNSKGKGTNTESFDPASTFVRPSMRIVVGPNRPKFDRPIKHDDCVVVPDFFCAEDDWSMYYKLVEEMREAQRAAREQAGKSVTDADWLSWHEGCHLISKNPKGSPTFQRVLEKTSEYFATRFLPAATRFNWYRDSSDWKPFHHDSAAFNPHRARTQNITVGVSFGSTRELAFLHAKDGTRLYFPQTNGMLFAFGRDVNINWKHGVNALPVAEHDGKGRVSIILWGQCDNVIEEDGSPPLLDNGGRFGGRGGKGGKGGRGGKGGKGGKGGRGSRGGGGGGGGGGGRRNDGGDRRSGGEGRGGYDRDGGRGYERGDRDRGYERGERDRGYSRDQDRDRGRERDYDRDYYSRR